MASIHRVIASLHTLLRTANDGVSAAIAEAKTTPIDEFGVYEPWSLKNFIRLMADTADDSATALRPEYSDLEEYYWEAIMIHARDLLRKHGIDDLDENSEYDTAYDSVSSVLTQRVQSEGIIDFTIPVLVTYGYVSPDELADTESAFRKLVDRAGFSDKQIQHMINWAKKHNNADLLLGVVVKNVINPDWTLRADISGKPLLIAKDDIKAATAIPGTKTITLPPLKNLGDLYARMDWGQSAVGPLLKATWQWE